MWIDRELNIPELLNKNSYFLFGPRAVGKSQLIRKQQQKDWQYINLLDSKTFLQLQASPSSLNTLIHSPTVVIDEIQRIPELLNQIHLLIEESNTQFLLTGSSARKLKRGGANLLAGRAFQAALFPLTWRELGDQFELDRYLMVGGLPLSYLSEQHEDFLHAYVDTYLKEEIQAEALVRNLPNYHRFLQACASRGGQLINYTKVANDAQLSPNTVRDYYQILEDTLLGFQLPPWTKSKKRKAITTSKFYLFDTGVERVIRQVQNIDPKSDLYGSAFEQFLAMEIRAYLTYKRRHLPFCFWRSKSRLEVDFIIGDDVAIEVKASQKASERDHKGLKAIAEEKSWKHLLLVSKDETPAQFPSGVQHLHWESFLTKLWGGEIL